MDEYHRLSDNVLEHLSDQLIAIEDHIPTLPGFDCELAVSGKHELMGFMDYLVWRFDVEIGKSRNICFEQATAQQADLVVFSHKVSKF